MGRSKKPKKPKSRSLFARALESPIFRGRKEQSKKKKESREKARKKVDLDRDHQ